MPITGAVVVMPPEESSRRALLARLESDARVEIGLEARGRLAIVVETTTTREGQDLLRDVQSMEGVGAVLPVFHDFSDEPLGDSDDVSSKE
jgi:nitrate reductase NapAB chaperone NapD